MEFKLKINIFLLFSIFLFADDRGYIVKVGDMAPDFGMEFTDGSQSKLSDFHGKTVVLQFTASWCSVCRLEMPHLEKDIWQKYKDKDVILIGVDRDEPLETVIEFQKIKMWFSSAWIGMSHWKPLLSFKKRSGPPIPLH